MLTWYHIQSIDSCACPSRPSVIRPPKAQNNNMGICWGIAFLLSIVQGLICQATNPSVPYMFVIRWSIELSSSVIEVIIVFGMFLMLMHLWIFILQSFEMKLVNKFLLSFFCMLICYPRNLKQFWELGQSGSIVIIVFLTVLLLA